MDSAPSPCWCENTPDTLWRPTTIDGFAVRPSCLTSGPNPNARQPAHHCCRRRRLPLLGFQRSPLCRPSGGLHQSACVSTDSLRPRAAMPSDTPLLPFQRLQRLLPSPQLADGLATDRADSGVRAVSLTQHLSMPCQVPDTSCPSKVSPHLQLLTPHTPRQQCRLDASQSAHPLSSLVCFRRLSTC